LAEAVGGIACLCGARRQVDEADDAYPCLCDGRQVTLAFGASKGVCFGIDVVSGYATLTRPTATALDCHQALGVKGCTLIFTIVEKEH
jgi:hypothetical protein